jgi:hypothetical protein
VKRWLLVALAACANKAADAPPPPVAPMPAAEVQRGKDACAAYLDRACACADKVPAAKEACDLARPMPEALELQLSFAIAAETKKNDVLAAQAGVRKVVKACIEGAAKLATVGCQ